MRRFWKKLSIRYKITAVIILTILLVTVTIIPVTSYLIRDSLLRQQQAHLLSVRNLVMNLLEDYQTRVTDYSRLFSDDRELKDTLFYHTELAGEREHPLRAVTRLYKTFGVSSVEAGDAHGRVVAAAEDPGRHDIDRSSDGLIRSALSGKTASGRELTARGFLIKAAAPVYYNESQIIGTITSGILLDDERLRNVKQLSNTDIVITDTAGRVISATTSDPKTIGGGVQAPDADYLTMTLPLSDTAGRTIGNVVIQQENRLPTIIAKAHFTLISLLTAIAVLSIFSLYLVSRRLMRPLTTLREGVERIGKGEFGHRIEVTSQDEIGGLSEGFNKMAHNLERLRTVEERLTQSERLAAVGKFAAGIAHEINNPIGNVIGMAKLMRKNITDESAKEDIETIIKDADRCGRIVKDLLSYSRQSPPRREQTPLKTLIDDAEAAIRGQVVAKDIAIQRHIPDAVPELFVDPLQIGQALGNILLNAVQSIAASGTITIRASLLQDNIIDIAVTDTGCGIEDAIKDRIFYPFFTTKVVGEGTGLGLAISYGIIQNHGGEIIVESEKGSGSTFRVRLPAGDGRG